VDDNLFKALTGFIPHVVPEGILLVAACAFFLGGTWRPGRRLWGGLALVALAAAAVALWLTPRPGFDTADAANATLYASPLLFDQFAQLIRWLSVLGGAVLVLLSWDEVPDSEAADYHGCVLVIVAGMCLTGSANELVTLFLALELTSIPTYVLLYLPRVDAPAQEAAMKYFLLSVVSSGLLLFGFSYLYGLGGTTNLPALAEALRTDRQGLPLPSVAVVALVMVVAGLGFRMTAVPFHFYAPDVYQGTTTAAAGLLSFVPKVVGFTALFRVLGLLYHAPAAPGATNVLLEASASQPWRILSSQAPVLLWIMAAVTMSLGNVLALLQDNLKRILAYSSVAHAGYMLVGVAVALAPRLGAGGTVPVGGVESVLFYLIGYGAMTVGAFAVLSYLSTRDRPVETVEDVAGLAQTHPGTALLLALFLFSLIGMPLTVGFAGKFLIFFGAMDLPSAPDNAAALEQAKLFRILALIGMLNAAVGAWYYLRIAAVMYLRPAPVQPLEKARPRPVLLAVWACALFTLAAGIYPWPLLDVSRKAVSAASPPGAPAAEAPAPPREAPAE
jgi:NADH-quinone oxidoreductase subunit N